VYARGTPAWTLNKWAHKLVPAVPRGQVLRERSVETVDAVLASA
jgi:hypothetical protein